MHVRLDTGVDARMRVRLRLDTSERVHLCVRNAPKNYYLNTLTTVVTRTLGMITLNRAALNSPTTVAMDSFSSATQMMQNEPSTRHETIDVAKLL